MYSYFRSFMEDDFRTFQFSYLQETLSKHDFDPILLNDVTLTDDVAALDRVIKKRQLAGLVLFRRIENDEVIEYLKGLSIHLFSMTRCNEKMQFIPSVSLDNYTMGYLVGEHLAKRKFKHIAYLRVRNHQSGDITTQGLMDALAEKNMGISEDDIYFTNFDFKSGYDTVVANLDRMRQYDAIFAYNDTMALGVISALQDNGISVPGQISVIGSNDIPMAQWFSPRLTTVRTFVDKHARVASDRIVSMIKDGFDPSPEKHDIIKPELIIRESCL
ncbi:transcriptional regulator, LacI family [Paenibacillus sp. UNCCL117]|nr:LacI family transcriptional regulator [Paenibacillus sp. cl123]SFW59438.1 transcriptional regulator, LacI family [Paenibacillus sp. UNCCL117]